MDKIEILHLEFSKDAQGRWMIDLPYVLLHDDASELDSVGELDADLLDSFPKELRKIEPLITTPDAAETRDAVFAGLKSGGLRYLLARVDFSGRGKDARIACAAAAEIWWSVNEPGSFRAPVELGFREEGILAAAAYQWFSPADPDRFELKVLYFKKTAEGWIWAPGVVSEKERESQKILAKWIKGAEPEWRLSWRGTMLASSERIAKSDFNGRVEDGEVESLIGTWLAALSKRDLSVALSQIAWLGAEGEIPMKTLRNLSYDLESSRQGIGKLEKVYRSDSWVAVHLSTGAGETRRDIFLPILQTANGARVLPEIDLLAGESRTRKFLNVVSFDRLRVFAGGVKTGELELLFSEFEKEVKKGG